MSIGADTHKNNPLDKWRQELEAQAAQIASEDIQRLEAALAEADRLAKERVRREMGLPAPSDPA